MCFENSGIKNNKSHNADKIVKRCEGNVLNKDIEVNKHEMYTVRCATLDLHWPQPSSIPCRDRGDSRLQRFQSCCGV